MLKYFQKKFYKILYFFHSFRVKRERKKFGFICSMKLFDRSLYLKARCHGYKDWNMFLKYDKSMQPMTKEERKDFYKPSYKFLYKGKKIKCY
jgi:hypothetical protein